MKEKIVVKDLNGVIKEVWVPVNTPGLEQPGAYQKARKNRRLFKPGFEIETSRQAKKRDRMLKSKISKVAE
jgi:hypothetical protein